MISGMGIRQRLIVAVAGVLVVINAAFWVFYHLSRRNLEHDLDRQLTAVSRIIAGDIRGEFLAALSPGEENSRTYRNLRAKLNDVRDAFDLNRVMIVDLNKRLLVDAEAFVPIGEPVFLIESASREMQMAVDGESATTVVYRSADGDLYKSAFAPVRTSRGEVRAVLVAEASAAFLRQLDTFRQIIVAISIISVIGIVILGGLMTFSVVNPLIRLVRATEDITEGRYPDVGTGGSTEIRYLAGAMGRMADSIRSKEEKLKQLYEAESRRAEEIERYAQSLLSSIANGIVSLDGLGTVVVCNKEAKRILGVRQDDVIGLHFEKVAALAPLVEILRAAIVEGETVRDYHVEYRNLDDERYDLAVSAAPLHDGGNTGIAVTAVITDQTELLGLQGEVKRQETLAALGQMAAYVAHEVRNPLGSMKIHMDLMTRPNLDVAKRDEYIGRVKTEIDRLNGIVTQFLQYAAPERLDLSRFALVDVIGDAVVFAHSDESESQFRAEGNYGARRDILVEADRNQLMQMFLNLIINARDAMPDGGAVAIDVVDRADDGKKSAGKERRLRRRPRPPERGDVVVSICDTGRGIAPENLSRVFQPFFSTKTQGSGLGLALVQKVVDNHGGRVRIQSEPGRGTKVVLTLPIRVQTSEEQTDE